MSGVLPYTSYKKKIVSIKDLSKKNQQTTMKRKEKQASSMHNASSNVPSLPAAKLSNHQSTDAIDRVHLVTAKDFDQQEVTHRYQKALDTFVEKARQDPNVNAVILMGSLAYDQVWQKSDVDLLVVVRDQKLETRDYCIDEDNIILNVALITRSAFRAMLGRTRAGDFLHSLHARSKVIYTIDESIAEYLAEIQHLGTDDIELTFFQLVCHLVGLMEKIEKWLVVKNDPLYAQFYILKTSTVLADMKLLLAKESPNRESVRRVMELDPDFIVPFYERPMTAPMTQQEVYASLALMRQFLQDNLALISRPALRFMEDGELKTVTMLVSHFGIDSHGIYHVFDFLTEMGVVQKVTQTIRITPKGKKLLEETAFIYIPHTQ